MLLRNNNVQNKHVTMSTNRTRPVVALHRSHVIPGFW